MGEKGSRDFHFNVNVRTYTGSIARSANNEEPFRRAMEIQERKREKIEEEQKRLEAEKKAEEPAASAVGPPSSFSTGRFLSTKKDGLKLIIFS